MTFIRETRYLVLKVTDAEAALTVTERNILNTLAAKVASHRQQAGKTNLAGVFVEHDWPEHEPTWAAIEKRMTVDSQPDFITADEARSLGAGNAFYKALDWHEWVPCDGVNYEASFKYKRGPEWIKIDGVDHDPRYEKRTIA